MMKLEQAHIDQIRIAFEKMQSREDLLQLLNEAKPLIYGDNTVPFELKQLTWYANPKIGRKRYAEFKIKKKSGVERCIHAPVKGLKSLQKTLSFVLQCVYEPHNAAMGFVRGKSIVDNAKLHAGSNYVYNIDLKDFFPSVDQARVWKCLQLKPFNLNRTSSVEPQYMKWEDFKKEYLKTEEPVTFLKDKGRTITNTPYGTIYMANNFDKEKDQYIVIGSDSFKTKVGKSLEGTLWLVNKIPGYSRLDIANIIASLCCTEMEVERKNDTGEWEKVKRNVLPQGAPTSPVITNIVCQRLDYLLSGVAKRFGLKYSRYADDITFSSMHNVYQPESEFLKEMHRIIAEQNFHIKESKTRLQKDGYRKEVTGLLVNEKANVQQRYIKQLRMWLYYWERYGYERASGFFIQQYIADKGHVKNGKPDMANVISGKLDYLKMVKGADNELYLKLKSRFDALIVTNKNEVIKTPSISLEKILSIVDFENTYTRKEEAHQQDTNRLRININPIDSVKGRIKLKRKIVIDKGEFLPLEEFELCKKEFNKGKREYPNVPDAVLRRIEEFAFAPNPQWFIRKGNEKFFPKKGWAESSFVEWYNKDINMHPGFDSKWNAEMIIPFKESIEVRAGNLKTIIEEILITGLGISKSNFLITLSEQSINIAEFYTDVDKIKLALSHIIATIKDRADENFCFEI
ncbi:MAG: RNA-directed DNA polymerase [Bacteroidetes bacterium]|nr:RNA-directed DNA polymerase [Bacteroidota bacterium]